MAEPKNDVPVKTGDEVPEYFQAGGEMTQAQVNERNRRYWEQPGGTYQNGRPNPDQSK